MILVEDNKGGGQENIMEKRAIRMGDESGQSMVVAAMVLSVLMGFAALVIDVGMIAIERGRIQNAADAAALAGAQMLPENPNAAIDDATAYAALNGIDEGEIAAISVTTTDSANDTLQIELKREVEFGLARVLGLYSATVTVSATARTGGVVGAGALAPFAVEESVFAGLGQGDSATLKYNATNSENGNFLPLALDAPGASEYEENVKYGSLQRLCAVGSETGGCSSIAETEPGNVVGKTRSALDWVFANTTTSCDSYEEVFSDHQYDESRLALVPLCNRFTNPTAESYRLILVPIIDELCNGKCNVNIQGFGLFFIESYSCGGNGQGNSCDLVGRYAQAEGSVNGLLSAFSEESSIKSLQLIQ